MNKKMKIVEITHHYHHHHYSNAWALVNQTIEAGGEKDKCKESNNKKSNNSNKHNRIYKYPKLFKNNCLFVVSSTSKYSA